MTAQREVVKGRGLQLPLYTEMPGRVEPIKKLEHTGEPDRGEWIIPGELHV
jgi:hypothetical protein